jgi:hypothetical protein
MHFKFFFSLYNFAESKVVSLLAGYSKTAEPIIPNNESK